ncbi:28045_t:CDS:2, partial [Gigaspora margarita]
KSNSRKLNNGRKPNNSRKPNNGRNPIMVESPVIVESTLMVESPTIVESPMVESSMEEKNQTGENSVLRNTLNKRKSQKNKSHEQCEARLEYFQSEIDIDMNEPDIPLPLPSTILKEYDKVLLRQFHNKMDKLKHSECPTCKECFPSITLVVGELPEELQELTEIEEMLIAQVFPVMVVYRLCGGQHGYRGNIINFPQDVEEYTTPI